MPSVLTRETCWSPPPYQATDMPFGKEIRWNRRCVPQWVSVVIKQGKGTSSIGWEPIEQKFLSASTLESQSVLQRNLLSGLGGEGFDDSDIGKQIGREGVARLEISGSIVGDPDFAGRIFHDEDFERQIERGAG